MTNPMLPRRSFLQTGLHAGALSALLAAAPNAPAAAAAPAALPGRRQARNIIFLVSDGASTGTLTLADEAIRRRRGVPSWWSRLWMMQNGRRAWVGTSSANSLVTDSAAGASAWGVGTKVANGAVNVLPDGSTPTPILVTARDAGFATGLVTTTRVTDATPAAFIGNAPKRTMEQAIATQIIDRGADVVLGGGRRNFPAELLEGDRFEHIADRDGLIAASRRKNAAPKPLLGLFASGSMPYEIDRPASLPTLAEMTAAALARLSDHPRGFVIQVEGARVDHAAHDNDAAALLGDQIAFDDAVGVALAFAAERDDSLVIVTTDHGNANPGLTLYGPRGEEGLRKALDARRSFDWIKAELRRSGRDREALLVAEALGGERRAESRPGLPASQSETLAADAAAEGVFEPLAPSDESAARTRLGGVVREALGVELTPEEIAWVERRLIGTEPVNGFAPADSPEAALGAVLANHFGIAFVSTNHTADLVDAVAIGPGAERLAPMLDNTEFHGIMLDAIGLRG
ncbi:MAG TPA: alkaline phosphatase [Phycisphaerales bacterium]|nr:alkaline phosphatase [Phycisphaerales bacterium]HMP36579.1 alkaline phosphatase [Phycisphaerales bacterium]